MRQNIRELTPTTKVTIRQLFNDEIDDLVIIKALENANNKLWFDNVMKGQLDTPIGELCIISGGEKTRLCFAITLYQLEKNNCQWLILDEPEQGLDPEMGPEMIIKSFEIYKNVTIIMITHMCECKIKKLNVTCNWKIIDGMLISF